MGIGYGKAREVPLAIQKAVENARKSLIRVPKFGQTIPHRNIGRFGSGHVVLRPASPGTGVIAGGGVRAVLELAGIRDVLSKSIGTQNPINLVKATMAGLTSLRRPEDVAELRGLSIKQVLGLDLKEAAAKEKAAAEGNGAEDAPAAVDPVAEAAVVAEAPGTTEAVQESAGSDAVAEPTSEPSAQQGSDPTSPAEPAETAATESTEPPPSDG